MYSVVEGMIDNMDSIMNRIKSKSVVIVSCFIVSLIFGGVLFYSISKRNRIIRENTRVIKSLHYQNEILKLDIEKNKHLLSLKRIEEQKVSTISEIKKRFALIKNLKKIEEQRKKALKKNHKNVDKMDIDKQIKETNKVLEEWL